MGYVLVKFGVTSARLGHKRPHDVAARYGFTARVASCTTVADARSVERKLLRLGLPAAGLCGDGSTEFRFVTQADLEQAQSIVDENIVKTYVDLLHSRQCSASSLEFFLKDYYLVASELAARDVPEVQLMFDTYYAERGRFDWHDKDKCVLRDAPLTLKTYRDEYLYLATGDSAPLRALLTDYGNTPEEIDERIAELDEDNADPEFDEHKEVQKLFAMRFLLHYLSEIPKVLPAARDSYQRLMAQLAQTPEPEPEPVIEEPTPEPVTIEPEPTPVVIPEPAPPKQSLWEMIEGCLNFARTISNKRHN
jgi:hypothetical protein